MWAYLALDQTEYLSWFSGKGWCEPTLRGRGPRHTPQHALKAHFGLLAVAIWGWDWHCYQGRCSSVIFWFSACLGYRVHPHPGCGEDLRPSKSLKIVQSIESTVFAKLIVADDGIDDDGRDYFDGVADDDDGGGRRDSDDTGDDGGNGDDKDSASPPFAREWVDPLALGHCICRQLSHELGTQYPAYVRMCVCLVVC